MKAVVSDKLYIKLTDDQLEVVRPYFTHAINENPGKPPRYLYRFGRIAADTFWFPKQALPIFEELGIVPETVIDKRVEVPVSIPEPSFTLREDQAEIVDDVNSSCLINGKPGWGKSIAGLAIAHKLQQKTLVICTTTVIRDMWVKEVNTHFGIKAGIIGSGKLEVDSPIVVGNIQTVTKHAQKLSSMFGLVIADECHRTPSNTFLKVLDQSKAKYFIGLSGTLKRKDGLEVLFPGLFTNKLYIPPVLNTIAPTVHKYNLDIEFSSNQMIPWANKVTDLTQKPTYIEVIKILINMYISKGHKVLVVGDRLELLNSLYDSYRGDFKYIITGQKEHKTLEYRNKVLEDVAKGIPCPLFASTSIFAEGVSLNELSVVIMTTPTNNESLIEQIAGRVMRQAKNKTECIVVDLTLKGNTATRHATQRLGIYAKNNWKVVTMDSTNLSLSDF